MKENSKIIKLSNELMEAFIRNKKLFISIHCSLCSFSSEEDEILNIETNPGKLSIVMGRGDTLTIDTDNVLDVVDTEDEEDDERTIICATKNEIYLDFTIV